MHVEDGPVRRVTFDRPKTRNAMTAAVARELADALADLDPADHDAVVLAARARRSAPAVISRRWRTARPTSRH